MRRVLPLALLLGLALLAGSARGGPTRAQATVVWSSSGTLHGTFLFDFDGGGETSSGADVFWQQQTSTARKDEIIEFIHVILVIKHRINR